MLRQRDERTDFFYTKMERAYNPGAEHINHAWTQNMYLHHFPKVSECIKIQLDFGFTFLTLTLTLISVMLGAGKKEKKSVNLGHISFRASVKITSIYIVLKKTLK